MDKQTKICSKCGVYKQPSEFYNRKISKDGKTPECKVCANADKRKYYIKNKEQRSIVNKKYRESHRCEMREKTRKWTKCNPGYHKKYHGTHPEVARKGAKKVRARKMGWLTPKPMNAWFEGCHLHHLHVGGDTSMAIHVPSALHESIRHAYNRPESMIQINLETLKWYYGLTIDFNRQV